MSLPTYSYNTGLFDCCFHIADPSMRGALLVCMLALCLLTFDNSMIARAGKITKIRTIPEKFSEYIRCCIKKGCPFTKYEIHRLDCMPLGFHGGNKVDCICK